jgi:phage-related protein (TIGR01555 family)
MPETEVIATAKPRYRVPARSSNVAWTADNFQNFSASLGYGTDNIGSAATYGFTFITRNRLMLEAAYRGSWIVGAAVDIPADDMTRAGLELQGLDSDDTDDMMAAIRDLGLAQQVGDNIRWARLFGGAGAWMMIDGQDASTPLNMDSIKEGQFRGLHVFDRTVMNPTYASNELVLDLGPSFGMPEFYQTFSDTGGVPQLKIHHTRFMRQTGIEMPYYQKRIEQFWGESVVERIWDRLVGFDSATAGVTQLVYKAYLRIVKVKNLRQNIAMGGTATQALANQFMFMRQMQSNEGLSLIDGDDEFATFQNTFAGLDTILEQFGGQLCGALDLPYSRLFGQTPGGLASTGEGDMRNYDASNARKQETKLRRGWTVILDVLHRSVLGRPADPGFTFKFNPLLVPSEAERKTTGKTGTDAIVAASGGGIISQQTALRELRNLSDSSGLFSTISDDEIEQAEETVPTPEELAAMAQPADPNEGGGNGADGEGGDTQGGGQGADA